MSVAEKAYALLGALTPADIQALPPARRQQFAALCRQLASIAESPVETLPRKASPTGGVIHELRFGRQE